jgi:hypothetical protein
MRTLARRYYYLSILSVLGLIGTAISSPAAKAQSGVKIERARASGRPRQLHAVKPDEQNLRAERIRHVFSPQRRSGEPAASQLSGVNEHFAHARPQLGLTGVVKWFNPTKGFGFITPDEGSEDL